MSTVRRARRLRNRPRLRLPPADRKQSIRLGKQEPDRHTRHDSRESGKFELLHTVSAAVGCMLAATAGAPTVEEVVAERTHTATQGSRRGFNGRLIFSHFVFIYFRNMKMSTNQLTNFTKKTYINDLSKEY